MSDHPDPMSEGLHLDPEFALPPDTHYLRPPEALPEPTHEPGTTHIDMGVTSQPQHRVGQIPWLDPERMRGVFDHYGDSPLEKSLRDKPQLVPARNRWATRKGWGLNSEGGGLTTGDWRIGGKPVGETSDRLDNPGSRDRAERADDDASEAQRRGEWAPDPVGDALQDNEDRRRNLESARGRP